ncbi:MAG: nicotinate-nucleotide--dimethylbenzimidazole phosphoribosyltransferase [Lachnospiraceae bacterium]|nr:nicotinate-nucleotide--dimethylbenzimidazole phosphoribosyltransferase [Lachnospiraceae bacterium]
MECCGKLEELLEGQIEAPSKEIAEQIKKHWDAIAKPLDSMGRFENVICQIGSILGTEYPSLHKKGVIVFCADNGVVEEGISQSSKEVTAAVTRGMGNNETNVGRMAVRVGADVIPVDIGVNSKEVFVGVRQEKIAFGTRNFAREPAMTEAEALRAIRLGMELVRECREQGYELLGTGEMGIGNTTTSSAVAAALLHCPVEQVTGRGAGLDDLRLKKKKQVILNALERYQLKEAEPLTVLQCVGGLDIAGMVGVFLGGAKYRMPIVIDGVISLVAALLAVRILPVAREYMIPSHGSREPASMLLLQELGLQPFIHGDMALGEGTGAVMLFPLLDLALQVYGQNRTFEDIKIEPYRRFS